MPLSLPTRSLGYLVEPADWNALVNALNSLPVSDDATKLQTTVPGEHTLGVSTAFGWAFAIGGTYAPFASRDGYIAGLNVNYDLGSLSNTPVHQAAIYGGSIQKANSGTHSILSALIVGGLSILTGSATLTEAATVYIADAPTGGSPAAVYALHVAAGYVRFDGAGLYIPNLPTSNPALAGQIWNDGGTLKVSAG